MKGVVFCDEKSIIDSLVLSFEKIGVFMERGTGKEAFKNLPGADFDFLITEFPLNGINRKEFFETLSRLWSERKAFTVIIKEKEEELRTRDLKDFIHIVEKPFKMDSILKIIAQRMSISIEDLDVIKISEQKDLEEKLEMGLSHYGVGKLEEAYREWIEVLRVDNCNFKAMEYIKIAEKEFENAGVDLSEFRKITEPLKLEEKFQEELKLRGKDLYKMVDNIKVEEKISPLEAFILSSLDGKTPLRDILMILPENQKSCLKQILNHFILKGYVEKVN